MRTLIVMGKKIASARIRTGESAQEKYAGAELAKYLSKFGIPSGDGLTFDIGLDPALPKEGYVIRPGGGEITIRGGRRGVIYGTYGFLTHYAGTRFFLPGFEKLGEGDIVVDREYSLTPVLEQRRSGWRCCTADADWCVKNGVNNPAHAQLREEMGGSFDYADGMFCHTMERLTGVPQYSGQPCLSDPEVLKKVISGVRAILEKHPDASIISVTQNDNPNYCKCPKCAAVDAEEESHAGTMIRFINAVADDVGRDYPNVVIDTFAYQYTRKAPKITKPRPNVCIRLCSIECCRSHPLTDASCPKNAQFVEDLLAWNKICSRIYIWDYATDYSHYIPPFPNFRVLRENVRFYAEHGVRGMYSQGNNNSPSHGEFGELRCWLLVRLMMDPYMSTTEYYGLMDEFLEAYYGAGWRYLRAFIDWTCAEASGHHMWIHEKPFDIIPAEAYLAMEETIDGWWNKAEEMAGDRLGYVRRSRTQWEYIKLMLHPDPEKAETLRRYAEREKIKWQESCGDWNGLHQDLAVSASI